MIYLMPLAVFLPFRVSQNLNTPVAGYFNVEATATGYAGGISDYMSFLQYAGDSYTGTPDSAFHFSYNGTGGASSNTNSAGGSGGSNGGDGNDVANASGLSAILSPGCTALDCPANQVLMGGGGGASVSSNGGESGRGRGGGIIIAKVRNIPYSGANVFKLVAKGADGEPGASGAAGGGGGAGGTILLNTESCDVDSLTLDANGGAGGSAGDDAGGGGGGGLVRFSSVNAPSGSVSRSVLGGPGGYSRLRWWCRSKIHKHSNQWDRLCKWL